MPLNKKQNMERIQEELIKEARKLGITVNLLNDCATENLLLIKGKKEVVFGNCATPLDQLSYQAYFAASNKQYSKYLFERLKISHPKSLVFGDGVTEKNQIKAFMEQDKTYVCKPLNGAEGEGVTMNIKTEKGVVDAWNLWKHKYAQFMVEEQVAGSDLRLQAIGGKIVAACVRKPATVTGDGRLTIEELVALRQAEIKAQNPLNKLELDVASFELLKAQNLNLKTIPKEGQKVQLKYVANMGQGATSIDITDEIHPAYNEWIARITTHLNLSIFALDVLTFDHTQAPSPETAWALEINGEPYWYHHTFSERRTHNMAKLILEDVFHDLI